MRTSASCDPMITTASPSGCSRIWRATRASSGWSRSGRCRAKRRRRTDARWLAGQFLGAALVGAGRYQRGERLSGRALTQSAAAYLVQLIGPRHADSLDPLRRFEQVNAAAAREIDAALAQPPPAAA